MDVIRIENIFWHSGLDVYIKTYNYSLVLRYITNSDKI